MFLNLRSITLLNLIKFAFFKLRIVNKIKGKAINALFKKLRLVI